MNEKDFIYIELTPERLNALQAERERTQTGSRKLLKNEKPDCGLYPNTIERWLYSSHSARKDQYEYVLGLYAALPTYVKLTANRKNAIKAEIERTAIGTHALFNKSGELPPGLNAKIARDWLTHTKYAKKDHYELVLDLYKSQPSNIECDCAPPSAVIKPDDLDIQWLKRNKKLEQRRSITPNKYTRPARIPITDEMRGFLNSEIERTGVCLQILVRARPESANKITGAKISFWRYGRVNKANALEWEYIISALSGLPDKRG